MKERVRQVRAKTRLTQTDFATRMGVTRDIVASWENGRVEPPEALIRLMCREFGVSYQWLKTGSDPMDVPTNTLALEKFESILNGDNEFVKTVLRMLVDMPMSAWEKLAAFVDMLPTAAKKES